MIAVPILAGDDPARVARRLTAVAKGLTALAVVDLRERPRPPLYEMARRGRLVYRREPRPRERWLCPSLVLQAGEGDCEDFAAWRAAELQLAGEHAAVLVRQAVGGSETLYHAVVRRARGRVEDPSARIIAIERSQQYG